MMEETNRDDASKLEADVNWCRLQIAKLPVYRRNRQLCDRILNEILPVYAACFERTTWSKIRKKLPKELNETEPAISYILTLVENDDSNGDDHEDERAPFTIVDLCSGFGIASMLLSDLLDPTKVNKIYLLDKQWPSDIYKADQNRHISTDHILQRKNHWPIELRIRKIDLKRQREKDQLPQYVYGNSRIIFIGIHLCKSLSVHAINLFSMCPSAVTLILKPCCLPGTKNHQLYTRDKNHCKVPITYNFHNGYCFQIIDLYRKEKNRLDNEKQNEDVSPPTFTLEVSVPSKGNNGYHVVDEDPELAEELSGRNCCGRHHGGGGDGDKTHNACFSNWLDHLERGCQSKSTSVCRRTVEIQRHHFQNQFLFCQRTNNQTID